MGNQEMFNNLLKIFSSKEWMEKIDILEKRISEIENKLFNTEWTEDFKKEYTASSMVRYRFKVYRDIFEIFNDEKLVEMEGYSYLIEEIKKAVKEEDIQIINSSYGHDQINTEEEVLKVERKHYIDFEQKVDIVLEKCRPEEQADIKGPYDYDEDKK